MFTGGASLWNLSTLHVDICPAPSGRSPSTPCDTPEDGGDGNMWADNRSTHSHFSQKTAGE